MAPVTPPGPSDALVADLHMARFLHRELHQAFAEVGKGTMQTRADMLAIRAGQIDSIYQSLWEHLRRARTAMAALGRPTAGFDEAVAALGPIGTSMGVLGATNTFGMRPTISAGGIGVTSGGEVGAMLNDDGARIAKRLTDAFIELLPEVDWSQPPPSRAPVRAAVPDLQVIDDGSPVESVLPPRRAAILFWLGAAVALVGVVIVVTFALRGKDHTSVRPAAAPPPAPSAARPTVALDDLLALDTKRLGDVLELANDLPESVAAPARVELERRYLASLADDPLVTVLEHSDVAEDVGMSDRFFAAAAQRVIALQPALAALDTALTDDASPRLVTELGALLGPQFEAAATAADTVDAALALAELSARFGDQPRNQAAIAARLAVLVRRDLAALEVDVLDRLFLDQVRLGLPADLVAAIQAAAQDPPPPAP